MFPTYLLIQAREEKLEAHESTRFENHTQKKAMMIDARMDSIWFRERKQDLIIHQKKVQPLLFITH